ncbi:helix-turn-helix transcriptional regulator [Sphingomonas cynarae]|uniref:helix-turn-helix domain-containing protein n=1 Tax=Sphingomonas cynarae TaxID=930197 RepID=UPI0031D1E91E
MSVNRQIDRDANNYSLDTGKMTLGARIDRRRIAMGISQAELARRVGIRQSTINSLINGDSRSSRSITQIARELRTTPSYLLGETDDPDANAPPPSAPPIAQFVTMTVALPNEEVLTQMFLAMLGSAIDAEQRPLQGVELARDLAMLLPSALGNLRAPLIELRSADADMPPAQPEDDDGAEPVRRRA